MMIIMIIIVIFKIAIIIVIIIAIIIMIIMYHSNKLYHNWQNINVEHWAGTRAPINVFLKLLRIEMYQVLKRIKNSDTNIIFVSFLHSGGIWYLAMNLNPSDGHIMDYLTGWDEGNDTGSIKSAFTEDYINQTVWNMPVNNIAIVRHQSVLKIYYLCFFCI